MNKLESSEINPHTYGQMIHSWDTKMASLGKGQFLWQIMLGKLDIYMQKNKVGSLPYTILHRNILKWIKDLNIKTKIVKLLEENIGESFMVLDLTMISWLLQQRHWQ